MLRFTYTAPVSHDSECYRVTKDLRDAVCDACDACDNRKNYYTWLRMHNIVLENDKNQSNLSLLMTRVRSLKVRFTLELL
jgi:hypothetical protein